MHFLYHYFIPGTRGKMNEKQISSTDAAENFTLMVKSNWIQAWTETGKKSNRCSATVFVSLLFFTLKKETEPVLIVF